MAFDEELAARLRGILSQQPELEERRMFGGLAFLVSGHMCCGVVKQDVMLRLGEEGTQELLASAEAAVRPMDFTGRALKNMVYVDPAAASDTELSEWISRAVQFAQSLPPK